jgi:hypothetical protein
MNIKYTINLLRRFDCKNPMQLQSLSTEAAFTHIPKILQATNPNSFVETLT